MITMPTAAAAMTTVANQPMISRLPRTVNSLMIFLFAVISIIMAITGTATTP